MNYKGHEYLRTERNLFGEICLDGVALTAGDDIVILKFNDEQPYEENDVIYYGWMGFTHEEEGFQLLYNTDDNNPHESVIGL
ncbi:MAG: hypothetical protein Q8T08_11770 [Ignavibacteria bacterium]|nr:hypothetical protein [Ignavibacteria bacterium]